MSWWNARYKNAQGEYEITFASKDYEKTKAVEKVCQAVIDKRVSSRSDVEGVVHCKACKHLFEFSNDEKPMCNILADGYDHQLRPEPWFFCAYGARRGDNDCFDRQTGGA